MSATRQLAQRVLEHYGPGAHPSGSGQEVHGGHGVKGAVPVGPVSHRVYVKALNNAIKKQGHAAFVSPQTPASLREHRATTYTSKDGLAGYYMTSDGYIGGLFSLRKGGGREMLIHAVEHGATSLDCYSGAGGKKGFLDSLYSEYGFKETNRYPWNEEFVPPNWNYERDGRPDYVDMEWSDGDRMTVRDRLKKGQPLTEAPAPRRYWEDEDFMVQPHRPIPRPLPGKKKPKAKPVKEALLARRVLTRMGSARRAKDARFRGLARRVLHTLEHYGPGAHPSGSGQEVHAGGAGSLGHRGMGDQDRMQRSAFPGRSQKNASLIMAPTGERSLPVGGGGPRGGIGLLDTGASLAHAPGKFVDGKWQWDKGLKENDVSRTMFPEGESPDTFAARLTQQTQYMLDHPDEVARKTGLSREGQEASKRWYWNRHDETKQMARESGLSHDQVAAIAAVLSPSANWADVNKPALEQIARKWKENPSFTISAGQIEDHIKAAFPKSAPPAGYRERMMGTVGKKLQFSDPKLDPALRLVAGLMPSLGGGAGWSGLAKASRILSGQSVNDVVGGHKVRNFFNNIRHPNYRGSVTIDIHAARLLYNDFAMPSRDKRYARLLSNDKRYATMAAVLIEASRRVNMMPHAMQAYRWDTQKMLVPSTEMGANMKRRGKTHKGTTFEERMGIKNYGT